LLLHPFSHFDVAFHETPQCSERKDLLYEFYNAPATCRCENSTMDPFSLTVGIIGLVDGGLSLSKELKEKIDDFRDAGREVIELAHEIDLCTTLLDVLGESLDRPENAYPKNVVKQTKRLVEDVSPLAYIMLVDRNTELTLLVQDEGSFRRCQGHANGVRLLGQGFWEIYDPRRDSTRSSREVEGSAIELHLYALYLPSSASSDTGCQRRWRSVDTGRQF